MDRRAFLQRVGVVGAGAAAVVYGSGAVRPGGQVVVPPVPPALAWTTSDSMANLGPDLVSGSFIYPEYRALFVAGGADPAINWLRVSLYDRDFREVSGAGYEPKVILTRWENGPDAIVLQAEDVTWENSDIHAQYAVLTGVAGRVAQIDFRREQESKAGTFRIQWHPSGLLRVV